MPCRITTIVTLGATDILLSLLIRVQELVVDVVNLTLHLLIGRLHQVNEHIEHAKCVRLLLQRLSRQDRVERAIDVGSHLQVIMLHHVGQHLKNVDLLLGDQFLTFIFAPITQREVHK